MSGGGVARTIVAGVVGLAVGVAGSTAAAEKLLARSRASAAAPAIAAATDDGAVRALEARLASLENERRAALATPASAEDARVAQAAPPPPPPAGDESQDRATGGLAFHARAIAQHRADGRDPGWAARAEASLGEDLSKVARGIGASVARTECKTTSCVASLEWPSFDAARSSYPKVLHAHYAIPCAVEVAMPAPDASAAGQPYQADVVFGCTHARVD